MKRSLIGGATYNLGLLMRSLIGIGTPKGLQGRFAGALDCLRPLMIGLMRLMTALATSAARNTGRSNGNFMQLRHYAAA